MKEIRCRKRICQHLLFKTDPSGAIHIKCKCGDVYKIVIDKKLISMYSENNFGVERSKR